MHSSSCILISVCCIAFAYNFNEIAAAALTSNIAGVENSAQPLNLLSSNLAESAAHAQELQRQPRQIVVAANPAGIPAAIPGYNGYNVYVGSRKPYYGTYNLGYPLTVGYDPNNAAYNPYNAYTRVIYG